MYILGSRGHLLSGAICVTCISLSQSLSPAVSTVTTGAVRLAHVSSGLNKSSHFRWEFTTIGLYMAECIAFASFWQDVPKVKLKVPYQ